MNSVGLFLLKHDKMEPRREEQSGDNNSERDEELKEDLIRCRKKNQRAGSRHTEKDGSVLLIIHPKN